MKEIEFNLLDEPWIRVRDDSCQVHEVSLTDALLHAHQYTSLSGELPTQDIVILYLAKALCHISQLFKAVCAPGKDRTCGLDRFFHLLFIHKFWTQTFHDHIGIIKVIPDDRKHLRYLLLCQIHGQTFYDKEHFSSFCYLLWPCRIKAGTTNR